MTANCPVRGVHLGFAGGAWANGQLYKEYFSPCGRWLAWVARVAARLRHGPAQRGHRLSKLQASMQLTCLAIKDVDMPILARSSHLYAVVVP